jgi:hypothetical protein
MRNKSPPLLLLRSRVIGVNLEARVLSFENETSCLKDQIFIQKITWGEYEKLSVRSVRVFSNNTKF